MSLKKLLTIKTKQSGRDSQGHVSVRHRGGEHRRFLREMEWLRSKENIKAKIIMPVGLESRLFLFLDVALAFAMILFPILTYGKSINLIKYKIKL